MYLREGLGNDKSSGLRAGGASYVEAVDLAIVTLDVSN